MSNFKVGETVVCIKVNNNPINTYGFFIGCECQIREISDDGTGLKFFNMPDSKTGRPWAAYCFENKTASLSMQFTAKLKKDREELIFAN